MGVLRPYVKDVLVGVQSLKSVMFAYGVKQQNQELVLQLGREILLGELVKKKDVAQEKGVADEIAPDVIVLIGLKLRTLTDLCTKQRHLWTVGSLLINLLR